MKIDLNIEKFLHGLQPVETFERMFPEIEKSDDTKIKKTLYLLVKEIERNGITLINDVSTSSMLNWLEQPSDNGNKIGDWVAINNIYSEMCLISPLHIVNSDEINYRVEDINGNSGCPKIEYLTSHYHLWTMTDAKDGDVLCLYEHDIPKIIFILKGTPNKPYVLNYYCYYNITYPDFNFGSVKDGLVLNYETDIIKPATKEQRELLFQKMKEEGYKWDSENKKPIKI